VLGVEEGHVGNCNRLTASAQYLKSARAEEHVLLFVHPRPDGIDHGRHLRSAQCFGPGDPRSAMKHGSVRDPPGQIQFVDADRNTMPGQVIGRTVQPEPLVAETDRLGVMGLRFENIMYYLVVTFSITYLKVQVGTDTSSILWYLLVAHAVHFAVIPLVGRAADRFGRRPVYFVGAVLGANWGLFAFPMMNTGNYVAITGAITLGLMIHALMYAPQPAIMAEMFPTRMRYSGVFLGYQVTSIVAGSLAPIIRSSCWRSTIRRCRLRCIAPARVPSPWSQSSSPGRPTESTWPASTPPTLRTGLTRRKRSRERPGRTYRLVTGGASGIGAACARELAGQGATVTLADVAAAALAAEIGGKARAVDLLDVEALAGLRLDTDILVNNAGVQRIGPIADFAPEKVRAMLALMVEAPFLLIRAVLPHMYAREFGRIISISSVHGLRASEFKVTYVTAKHGLQGLSKVTALEGGPHGVTSNCVNPGYVRTPLVTKQIADQARTHGIPEDQVLTEILLTESAIKRLVEPEEVAALVGWLASSMAGMVTGASYTMDGREGTAR
jgi:3-hydroxybutyrate dehydrogenase